MQRRDEPVRYRHGFDGQQRNDGRGDEEHRRHAGCLAPGEQEKREEGHQRDGENQDERTVDKNLGEQDGEGAGGHHDADKGDALLDA